MKLNPWEQQLIVKEARIDGSPLLVVEIMSPSTTRKDRLQRMRIYQKAQVQHYWLVLILSRKPWNALPKTCVKDITPVLG